MTGRCLATASCYGPPTAFTRLAACCGRRNGCFVLCRGRSVNSSSSSSSSSISSAITRTMAPLYVIPVQWRINHEAMSSSNAVSHRSQMLCQLTSLRPPISGPKNRPRIPTQFKYLRSLIFIIAPFKTHTPVSYTHLTLPTNREV